MCRDLIRINHSSRVSIGTTIKTRIRAKGGVVVRTIRVMVEEQQNNMPPPRVSEPSPEKKVDLEQALAQMLTSHTTFMNETKVNMQHQATQLNNQAAQMRNLEVQMGQMANLLTERQQGSLPSNSEVNPRRKGNEHVKAVTLRSGRELAIQGQPPVIGEKKLRQRIIQSRLNP